MQLPLPHRQGEHFLCQTIPHNIQIMETIMMIWIPAMVVNQVSPQISTLHLGIEGPLDTTAISVVHTTVSVLTAASTALQVVEMGYVGYGRRVLRRNVT